MNRKIQILRGAAVFVGTFAVTAAASHAVTGRLREAPAPPPAPRVESFDFDAGMTRFTGALSGRALAEVRRAAPGDQTLVLLLKASDVVTCEDLGRQVRELKRAYGPERPLLVWGDSARPRVLESFLRRERISGTVVSPIPTGAVMSDAAEIATPAVLVVDGSGRVIEAVSHTKRAPNVRLRSFAAELRSLRPAGNAPAAGAEER